ncbi:hypothetical protein V6N12_007865 [Hibiscus sabdariffa]|uniref:Uncharacterized protein n=1 Tax=Hibiscus sabdariffa TaxID=183260 RepID=A0ABR2F327_9ROSI
MGSRFEILEDETDAMGEGADVVGTAAFLTANPSAGGVAMEDSGYENWRLGASARSPRKRDTVVEGRLMDSYKESVLHGRGLTSEGGVGAIKERIMR